MTKEQWLILKPGDVIIEVRTGVERVLLDVKRYKTPRSIRTSITVAKLYDGSSRSPNTTYNNQDDRGRWRLKGRLA